MINDRHFKDWSSTPTIRMICPRCGHLGSFNKMGQDRCSNKSEVIGMRTCPNDTCRLHLSFILNQKDDVLSTWPPLRITFNSESIPDAITRHLAQAITCHAEECYIPAAIMVRRTLEELCEERGATGKTLFDRIKQLKSKVILPQELLDALDDLRLLGNDAAHVDAKTYNQVGKEEVEVAIEVTKEILKACYQMSELVDRLKALQK